MTRWLQEQAEKDHVIRLLNRTLSAIERHEQADRFKEDHDEALYAARDRIVKSWSEHEC